MTAFGTIAGTEVPLIRIEGGSGVTAALCPYGARLVSLAVPDRTGAAVDVVLGHDDLQSYLDYPTYFGATCGRYANRIVAGRFVFDGREVALDRNEGKNHLHGGSEGFDRKLWQIVSRGEDHVTFSTTSPDGEMGYPGTIEVSTTYRLTGMKLVTEMTARTDAPTVVNIVNHAYFNLAGQGDVLDHLLELPADFYTPVTDELLTTGAILPVAGSGFDFRSPRRLRDAMASDGALADGWDHNWCLRGPSAGEDLHLCARLSDPSTGITMELRSDQPGVQIYSCGQMRNPVPGKNGQSYGRFAGLTFETQKFPCSPNHLHFPSARLEPGMTYENRMEFTFSA